MLNRQEVTEPRNLPWQKASSIFNFLAEFANVGIGFSMISNWLPLLARFTVYGLLVYIFSIADLLIPCFRALMRMTRIIGRVFFDIKFEEDTYGKHPYQILGDILSCCLFISSSIVFLGVITIPYSIPIAWCLSLSGQCLVAFFDYYWPEKLAKEQYQLILKQQAPFVPANNGVIHNICKRYENEYEHKKTSRQLFVAVIASLFVYLGCSSLIDSVPSMVSPILLNISRAMSVVLVCLGGARAFFSSCHRPELEEKEEENDAVHNQESSAHSQYSNSHRFIGAQLQLNAPQRSSSSPPSLASPLPNGNQSVEIAARQGSLFARSGDSSASLEGGPPPSEHTHHSPWQ